MVSEGSAVKKAFPWRSGVTLALGWAVCFSLSLGGHLEAASLQEPAMNLFKMAPKVLVCPVITKGIEITGKMDDPLWQKAAMIDDLEQLGTRGSRPTQSTKMYLCRDDQSLFVGWKFSEQDMAHVTARRDDEDYWFDMAQVFLDVTHEHQVCWQFEIGLDGAVRYYEIERIPGELAGDETTKVESKNIPGLLAKTWKGKNEWRGEIKIPLAGLGSKPFDQVPVWGFNLERYRSPHAPEDSMWVRPLEERPHTALWHGDLFMNQGEVQLKKVDLGEPVWGDNQLTLELKDLRKNKGALWAQIEVWMPWNNTLVDRQRVKVEPDAKAITIPYELDGKGRWFLGKPYQYQNMILTVENEQGSKLYLGGYPFSYDTGLITREPYGAEVPALDPKSKDEYLRKKWSILGKLPLMERTGTDGSILQSQDGKVVFNTYDPDVLKQMAGFLGKRFSTDTDRLVGAMYFIHQRQVTRHSGILDSVVQGDIPRDTLRLGGALCSERAALLGKLISEMTCQATGKPFQAHLLELKGHVVLAVDAWPGSIRENKIHSKEWADNHFVLDPDVGCLFLAKDNSRLATLTELREDSELSYRANLVQKHGGPEFYYKAYHQWLVNSWPE